MQNQKFMEGPLCKIDQILQKGLFAKFDQNYRVPGCYMIDYDDHDPDHVCPWPEFGLEHEGYFGYFTKIYRKMIIIVLYARNL